MRNSMARRISLRRPKQWELEALREAIENARARGAEEEAERLLRELDRLEHRSKIIPYIDPIDVRYNRFERVPRPNTEAVMFCLMDVSGSMTEAMKDLAKRFFMLLHVFLIRRYRHVDIVFIRHTSTAEEVDEETFFYSRETGGTVVSTALEKMLEIARARYPTDRWNIYAAQASDGDNYGADSGRCVSLAGRRGAAALPVLRLCRGRRRHGREPDRVVARQRSVESLQRGGAGASAFRDAAGRRPVADLLGVPRIVCKGGRPCLTRCRRRAARGRRRRSSPARIGITRTLRRVYDAIERIALDELGLDVYPVQIEVITSEQMLDAYASVGLPLMYRHWSFGKRFAYHETLYRKGLQGLAYEIVINSNPCICYIMEENSMTMQTLVMAHAAFGHNHFFKNNYLFRQWTDANGILDYLSFARDYVAEMRGAARRRGGRAGARRRARAEGPRRQPLRPSHQAQPRRGAAPGRGVAGAFRGDLQRSVAHRARRRKGQGGSRRRARRGSRRSSASSACPRRTCSISSRSGRRGSRIGNASWSASCA